MVWSISWTRPDAFSRAMPLRADGIHAGIAVDTQPEERSRSRLVGPILSRRAARLPTSLCSDSIGPQHAHLWKGAVNAQIGVRFMGSKRSSGRHRGNNANDP